ncbi:hypothetical protein IWW38_003938, partial [Coemansia aciculifera]
PTGAGATKPWPISCAARCSTQRLHAGPTGPTPCRRWGLLPASLRLSSTATHTKSRTLTHLRRNPARPCCQTTSACFPKPRRISHHCRFHGCLVWLPPSASAHKLQTCLGGLVATAAASCHRLERALRRT